MTGNCKVTISHKQRNKTHLITTLVSYLDAPIEASLMGLDTLCESERQQQLFTIIYNKANQICISI